MRRERRRMVLARCHCRGHLPYEEGACHMRKAVQEGAACHIKKPYKKAGVTGRGASAQREQVGDRGPVTDSRAVTMHRHDT